jgi:hypothetical protein
MPRLQIDDLEEFKGFLRAFTEVEREADGRFMESCVECQRTGDIDHSGFHWGR